MPWLKDRDKSNDDSSRDRTFDEGRRSTYDEGRPRDRVEKLERPQDWPDPPREEKGKQE